MKTVYLCGPINGCTDEECNDWRQRVRDLFEEINAERRYRHEYITLDPMRRDYRGQEHDPAAMRELVEFDKIDVAQSDALIISYTRPSVGTAMEQVIAWNSGKFIVLVVNEDMVDELSPWTLYHAHAIVYSYETAVVMVGEMFG